MNEDLIQRWKSTVFNNADTVDPEGERDWFDVAYGFFLGSGLDPENAYDHAIELLNRGML